MNAANIKPIILRSSNVYGFGSRPNYNSAIATFIENLYNNKKIILNNKGYQKRNFIYIKDVCRIIDIIILSKNIKTGIYNLTSDETIRICDALKYIEKLLDKKVDMEYKSIPEKINQAIIQNEKLLKNFYNIKFTKFKEGIKEYIDEYRKSKSNKT